MDGQAVVLQGIVADDDERRLVENMVLLTPGVTAIRNELAASRNPALEKVDDLALLSAAKRLSFRGRFFRDLQAAAFRRCWYRRRSSRHSVSLVARWRLRYTPTSEKVNQSSCRLVPG